MATLAADVCNIPLITLLLINRLNTEEKAGRQQEILINYKYSRARLFSCLSYAAFSQRESLCGIALITCLKYLKETAEELPSSLTLHKQSSYREKLMTAFNGKLFADGKQGNTHPLDF